MPENNDIDRAYDRQMKTSYSEAKARLKVLEKEILEARTKMREAWAEICKIAGVPPTDYTSVEVLEVVKANEALASRCQFFAKIFTTKINQHLKICRLNHIKPDRSFLKQKEEKNGRHHSNNRKGHSTGAGGQQRPPGRSDGRRVPRRRSKRQSGSR